MSAVHLLHTELSLAAGEYLSFREPGSRTRSPLHVDHRQVATALFGDDLAEIAAEILRAADQNADRMAELAYFFASPAALTEARNIGARAQHPDQPIGVDLDEQARLLRAQATADPTVGPALARVLLDLGNKLGEVGRRDEALAAVEEAVTVRREMFEADPSAYLPDLAASLNDLSVRLSGVGRRDEALGAISEAVAIRRQLAGASPAAYLPDLAGSLNNLANRLSGVGSADEAERARAEAVSLTRSLLRDES